MYFLGKYEDAVRSLDNALILRPEYYEILNINGTALSKLGKYDEAIKVCEIALTVKPDYFDALYNMAYPHAFMGKQEKVSDALSKFIKLDISYKDKLSKDPRFKDCDFLH